MRKAAPVLLLPLVMFTLDMKSTGSVPSSGATSGLEVYR